MGEMNVSQLRKGILGRRRLNKQREYGVDLLSCNFSNGVAVF